MFSGLDDDSGSGKSSSLRRSLLTPDASSVRPLGIAPTNPLGHQIPFSSVGASVPKSVSSEVPSQPFEVSKPLASTGCGDVHEHIGQLDEIQASGGKLHGPLAFRIPEARWREIRDSSKTTSWSHTLYQGPDNRRVEVYYCQNKEDSERIALKFLDQEVIGFDIEWKPSATKTDGIREQVALVQLASEERIALFHIARYSGGDEPEDLVAPSLQKIMESPDIIKAGVAIKGDCTRLRRMGIDSRGLLELSYLYKLVKFFPGDVKKINRLTVPLALQVEEHLKLPLSKDEVRVSDWTDKLNEKQIECKVKLCEDDAMLMLTDAACDAYAGLQLFYALEWKRKALSPSPPRPSHAELNLSIQLTNNNSISTDEQTTSTDEQTTSTDDKSSEVKDEGPGISPSIEEMACEFRDTVIEGSTVSKPGLKRSQSRPPQLGSQRSKRRPPQSSTLELRPELVAAEDWIVKWRGNLPPTYKPRARSCTLRAYALWHEQQLDVNEAASILRDPPLKDSTVAGYIAQCLYQERLPYQSRRISGVTECLDEEPKKLYGAYLKRLATDGYF
ncbi:hypothetical protein MMC07_002686 [Pseudocyphellaria aurata]|nr:hypothetical protein [Pseudocyphellaria aurata]